MRLNALHEPKHLDAAVLAYYRDISLLAYKARVAAALDRHLPPVLAASVQCYLGSPSFKLPPSPMEPPVQSPARCSSRNALVGARRRQNLVGPRDLGEWGQWIMPFLLPAKELDDSDDTPSDLGRCKKLKIN